MTKCEKVSAKTVQYERTRTKGYKRSEQMQCNVI